MLTFSLLKQAASEWKQDNAARLGAALSYYTIFSLAPFLVITLGIIGLVYSEATAQQALLQQLRTTLGPDAAALLQTMLENASNRSNNIAAIALGTITAIFGAIGLFKQLKDSVATIWNTHPRGSGLRFLLRENVSLFGLTLVSGFLLLVSLGSSTLISALNTGVILGQTLNELLAFVVSAILFAILFKNLSGQALSWKHAWPAAWLTSLLFSLGKYLIGLYLGQASVGSTYGAAGSLAILLIWIYYAAQIFLYGVEVSKVSSKQEVSQEKEKSLLLAFIAIGSYFFTRKKK